MGYQLRDVDTKGNLPGSVIQLFNQGTGNSIKRDQYIYAQAIEAELASIEAAKEKQRAFQHLVSTAIGATLTGASVHLWGLFFAQFAEGENNFNRLLAPDGGYDSSMSDYM